MSERDPNKNCVNELKAIMRIVFLNLHGSGSSDGDCPGRSGPDTLGRNYYYVLATVCANTQFYILDSILV